MKMIMRWFGTGHDSVGLEQIRQIPNVTGIAGTLMDKQPGELWNSGEINALKAETEAHGLQMEVIESVNIHDDIKLGLPSREAYIENYRQTIANLGKAGVRVICYNFMPVFDWMRTDLQKQLADGSFTMYYDHRILEGMDDPKTILKVFQEGSSGFDLPGWEEGRMAELERLFEQYEGITSEKLHQNLKYFLEAIMPACERYDVKMAIHPDDPPWNIFGLPRVFSGADSGEKILRLVNNPYNGLTFCTGSLGVEETNNLPDMIEQFGNRIHFAHVRNFKRLENKNFYESSHLSSDGSLDMFGIMQALHRYAPDCYIRPDHGRMIWGETARPGYGLYDRAMGVAYLNGLWEALCKAEKA